MMLIFMCTSVFTSQWCWSSCVLPYLRHNDVDLHVHFRLYVTMMLIFMCTSVFTSQWCWSSCVLLSLRHNDVDLHVYFRLYVTMMFIFMCTSVFTSVRFPASENSPVSSDWVVIYRHCLVTLPVTVDETLTRLSSLPILKQNRSGGDSVASVSYTHLRAHETA